MKIETDIVMIVLKGGNNSAKGETIAHMSELQCFPTSSLRWIRGVIHFLTLRAVSID